jgi:hypothetical protein
LLSACLTYFALASLASFEGIAATVAFAASLVVGAHYRLFYWALVEVDGDPPRGAEWAGALVSAAAWSIILLLVTGVNLLLPMAVGVMIAHGCAKLSCARLGCCRWRRFDHLPVKGQILEAAAGLVVGFALLGVILSSNTSKHAITIVAVLFSIAARSLSLWAQRRSLLDPGVCALATVLGMAVGLAP